ncbi:MAG: LPS export ABC transporter periplasmic protein LptC [Nitrospirae bacterium]|nr:LPS export ABC transporter periplasmic protein LptC [Nitrospirota bacterium]
MIDYCMTTKRFVWVLSLFLVAGCFILSSYYKDQRIKIQPSFHTSTMHDLHLAHRENDEVKWELSATEAVFPIGGEEVFLKSLGLKINQPSGIYLESASAIYEIEGRNVTLNKPVELNMKDAKFTTDSLKWNSVNGLITTEDDVKLIGKNFVIEGTGLSAKTEQQYIRILKNVKAVFNL